MHDEGVEFYGRDIDYDSINFQIKFLVDSWFKNHDLSSILLLKVLIDGIIKGENLEHLYKKAIEVSQHIND